MMGGWKNRFENSENQSEEDRFQDLLVFGYHCKLFRDDEKALYVDQGKHLIPWPGDENVKIDRYDGRLLLFDLHLYEAPPGGYCSFETFTAEEKHVEHLCDEERYLALNTNLDDENTGEEEKWKRLCNSSESGYHEVSFSYSDSISHSVDPENESLMEQEDPKLLEPFIPPPQLDLPADIQIPCSIKEHRIIEKTAFFIGTQGAQMEVILKTKQAANPQFAFLNFDCPLNPYYRYLLAAIRTGKYQMSITSENDSESDDDQYLHPSLSSQLCNAKSDSITLIPNVKYQPSEDCKYAKLVNQIKSQAGPPPPPPPISTHPFFNQIQTMASCPKGIKLPPANIRIIVDKMASYVARNDKSIEQIVMTKKDPRFDFLNSKHQYSDYYSYKLSVYLNYKNQKSCETAGGSSTISFSIKSRDSELTPLERSALPTEDSEEERESSPINEANLEMLSEDPNKLVQLERKKKVMAFLNKIRSERKPQSTGINNNSQMNQIIFNAVSLEVTPLATSHSESELIIENKDKESFLGCEQLSKHNVSSKNGQSVSPKKRYSTAVELNSKTMKRKRRSHSRSREHSHRKHHKSKEKVHNLSNRHKHHHHWHSSSEENEEKHHHHFHHKHSKISYHLKKKKRKYIRTKSPSYSNSSSSRCSSDCIAVVDQNLDKSV